MDFLFWTAFSAMALLLVARLVVPAVAPDTVAARWLTTMIKIGEDDADADQKRR